MLRTITGGVDTHLDVHVAAALDQHGTMLGVESFETTTVGYRKLLEWLRGFGQVCLVGVEGTGSYGAGLTRHLHHEGIAVVEVDRPNRQRRRRKGKSDPQDAISAPEPRTRGTPTGSPRPATATWSPFGHCGSHGSRRARRGPRRSIRCAASSRRDPSRSARSFGA
jgi:transposase